MMLGSSRCCDYSPATLQAKKGNERAIRSLKTDIEYHVNGV
jgi:hypothetical protein